MSTDTDCSATLGAPSEGASCAATSRPAGVARSAHGFDGRRENVSGASLGADERRARALRLDLLAETTNLHVDRSVINLVVVKARSFENEPSPLMSPATNGVNADPERNEPFQLT